MTSPTSSSPPAGRQPGLAATLGMYTAARIALVGVVTALLLLTGVPFAIALLVALIVALPLSMVLFRGLRARLEEAFATVRERRAREREALRARLRGDVPPETAASGASSDEPADHEADRGQH
jgi:membrane protein implicated in regulation of membrane protease activity